MPSMTRLLPGVRVFGVGSAAKQRGAIKNEVSRAMRWMFICRFYGRPLLETGQRPLMSRFWDHGNSDRHVVGAEEYFDRNDALVG